MRSNIIISLLSLLIIAFSSCKKSTTERTKVYVPAYLKAMAPYTNGQSLSFRNGSGQVVNATVSITSTFSSSPVCGGCPDVPNPELLTYSLNAGTNKFIVLEMSPESYINLSVYSPLDNFQSRGGFNFSVDAGLTHGSCFAQGQTCLSSISLNGKTFTDVVEITASFSGSSSPVKAYHTVSQGIVGFKYANGTAYALD